MLQTRYTEDVITVVSPMFQTSAESPGIFLLLQKLFAAQKVDELRETATQQGISEEEWKV